MPALQCYVIKYKLVIYAGKIIYHMKMYLEQFPLKSCLLHHHLYYLLLNMYYGIVKQPGCVIILENTEYKYLCILRE